MLITPGPRSLAIGGLAALALLVSVPAAAQAPATEAPPPAASETAPAAEPAPELTPPTEWRFEAALVGGGHFFTEEHGLGRNEGDPIEKSPDHGGAFGLRLTFNFNRWVA